MSIERNQFVQATASTCADLSHTYPSPKCEPVFIHLFDGLPFDLRRPLAFHSSTSWISHRFFDQRSLLTAISRQPIVFNDRTFVTALISSGVLSCISKHESLHISLLFYVFVQLTQSVSRSQSHKLGRTDRTHWSKSEEFLL